MEAHRLTLKTGKIDKGQELGEEKETFKPPATMKTFHRFNVPATLNVTFQGTEPIENAMRNSRAMICKVCRWNAKTGQPTSWLGVALLLVQEGFLGTESE